ncbi:hypothetical protein PULV_b0521 [Pseudoalteromonas ulvae UL12]|nr:hypothetical protein [Pseudoalteromonas ulvae UL12]
MCIFGFSKANSETYYLQAQLHSQVTSSGSTIDDVAESIRTPIGFNFELFGKTVDHFSITSNGVIALRKGNIGDPGADAAPVSSYYTNQPLSELTLTGSGQDSYNLYVFWDDLVSKDAKQHVTSLLVPHNDPSNSFGTDILAIQYSNYGFYSQTLGLGTIQVVLVSGSNEIYFNYVDLPNERSKATEATIGITGGTEFVQTSHNSPILDRLQNIKYTPNGSNYDVSGPNPGIAYNGILYVSSPPPGAFALTSPSASATDQIVLPTFTWSASDNVATYKLIVATDSNLNNIVYQNDAIDAGLTSFTLPSGSELQSNQVYYWNLQAINAEGELWAVTRQFTTTQPNQLPVITNSPATTIAQDAAYAFQTTVTDADTGDTHTFSITNKPSWATFSAAGLLSGTPTNSDVGNYPNINITVTDNHGGSASTGAFTISVQNVNDAPSISGTPLTSVLEDSSYTFTPNANDVDTGDNLTFSITNKPAWVSFNSVNGQLSGIPTNSHVGSTDNIVISVSDGQLVSSLPTFRLTVINTNDSPSIFGQPVTQINEDSYYQFTPSAYDEDVGDSLTFSIQNKPNWANFNPSTGELYGTPLNQHVGTYNNVVISVSDSNSSVSLPTFFIEVSNTNDAPTISGTPQTSMNEDTQYQFTPTAHDEDLSDTLTFSITNKPSWASFDTQTGRLSGTPSNDDVGTTTNIVISVKDLLAQTSLPPFSLTVVNTNDAPTISGTPQTSVNEDMQYQFTPTAHDEDLSDTLTFSITNKPSWASFDTQTGRLSGTPSNDDVGTTTNIVISVKDLLAQTSLPPFSLTVVNTNDAPTISGTPQTSVNEDMQYQFTPTAHDEDLSDTLTFSITNKPSWASFDTQTGRLSGTPSNDDVGTTYDIELSVTDKTQTAQLPLFSITVKNVNDKPTSEDLSFNTKEDQGVYFHPKGHDIDQDALSFVVVKQPTKGTLSQSGDQWLYTPNKDVHGVDTITYHAFDQELTSDSSLITITINPENDAPIAVADNITLPFDASERYELDVLANDIDVDEDELRLASVSAEIGNVSIENNKILYQALAGTSNTVTLMYSITDVEDKLSATSVTLHIKDSQMDLHPHLNVPDDLIVNATGLMTKVDLGVATATDQAGNPLAVSLINPRTHFRPGAHSVFWQAVDADNRQTIVKQTVTVNPLISIDRDIAITEGSTHQVTFHLNGQPASYPFTVSYAVSGTATGADHALIDGEVTFNEGTKTYLSVNTFDDGISEANETIIITLNEGQNISDNAQQTITIVETTNIVISVKDLLAQTSLPPFSLTVVNTNDAPTISGTPQTSVNEDMQYQFTPTAHDEDLSDTLTFSITNKPSWASFDTQTGRLSGTPSNDDVGTTYDIELSVTDKTQTAQLPLFSITVKNVNDKPTSEDLSFNTKEDQGVYFHPKGHDIDQDALSFVVVKQPTKGTLSQSGDQWLYTPNKDVHGVDTITYHAFDQELTSDSSLITITINPENDAPIAVADNITLPFDASERYELDVLANDIDVDEDELRLASVSAEIGNVSIENNKILYQALAGTSNTVTLMYSITDVEDKLSATSVTLHIKDSQMDLHPHLNVPDDLIVNATGLMTKVDLGVATATDQAGNPLAVSLINPRTHFRPGAHSVFWQAVDADNRQTIVKQTVTVNPLISIDRDIAITEGSTHQVTFHLNGQPASYPFTVSYAVSGTATGADHALIDGEVTFNEGTKTYLSVNTFDDGISEANETIIITLNEGQNISDNAQQTITIVEHNLPPVIDYQVIQAGQQRNVLTNSNETVSITSQVNDPNEYDVVTLAWHTDSENIINISSDDETFTFNPTGLLPGIYTVEFVATDNAEPALSSKKTIYLEVTTELTSLTDLDSDGDLIPDHLEGFKDSDQDGIPDYLDAISECNVMQEQAMQSNSFLVESEPGICMRKGSTIANNQTGGIELLASELPTDTEADNLGGIFDFILEGLPTPGESYRIVLPQVSAIPANAVYRKLINNQWTEFLIDEHNAIHSAAGEPGYCPTTGDPQWRAGLQEGAWCVQLTIQDGGKNDADGIKNGTIVDPSGVAVYQSQNTQPKAISDHIEINWNSDITIDVLTNDYDDNDDSLMISAASVDFGAVSIVDNQLYYQTAAHFYGTATIQYSISDGQGGTSSTTVSVIVNANFAPIAHPDTAQTNDRTVITISVLANDEDPENQDLFITSINAEQGTAVINSDQSITYTPKIGFEGIDTLSYEISDGQLTSTSYVTISVEAYQDVIIKNHSGGSLNSLLILLLATVMLIKQKAKAPIALLIFSAAIFSSKISADNTPWLLEISVGQSKVESSINQHPDEDTFITVDDTGTQRGIELSYHFDNSWALSLGYVDLGESDTRILSAQLNPDAYFPTQSRNMPLFTHGITLSGSYLAQLNQDWLLSYTLGAYVWHSDTDSQYAQTTIKESFDGVDPFLGLGLNYQINPSWQTGLQISRYFINENNTNTLSLNLGYQF